MAKIPSFRYSLIESLLALFARAPHVRLWYETDPYGFFAGEVTRTTGASVTHTIETTHSVVPLLYCGKYTLSHNGTTHTSEYYDIRKEHAYERALMDSLAYVSAHIPPHRRVLSFFRHEPIWTSLTTGRRVRDGRAHLSRATLTVGSDIDSARVHALLTAISSDAFLVHWITTTAPRTILTESYAWKTPVAATLYERIHRYKLSLHILDITSDIPVPTLLVMIGYPSSTGIRYGFGVASGFSFEELFAAAASQALGTCFRIRNETPFMWNQSIASRLTESERERLYTTDTMAEHLAFLTQSPTKVTVPEFMNHVTADPLTDGVRTLAYLTEHFRVRTERDAKYDLLTRTLSHPLLTQYERAGVAIHSDALLTSLSPGEVRAAESRITDFLLSLGITARTRNNYPSPRICL